MILTTTGGVIVVVEPEQPEPESPATWRPPEPGLSLLLTGADGSTWDLLNGPVQLQPGVVGLKPSNVEHRWDTSPMLPGAVHAGYGVGVQSVTLPVFVGASSGLGWRDLDRQLWRALDPEGECVLTVVTPDAQARRLPIRFAGVGDDAETAFDPIVQRYDTYQLQFVAADPYWQGDPVTQPYKPATPVTAYAPPGSAFVKTLMPGNTTANATLRNDGDVSAWPVVAVSGAVTAFAVTVDGADVSYGPVAAGQTVWIDYHPARQTVGLARGDNSEAAWLGVTAREFRPVPPGAEVPLGISFTAAGVGASLTVELTPRYRRPW